MKGQLNVEYYASFIIFLSVVTYLLGQVYYNSPDVKSIIKNELENAKAHFISEIIINDPGEPPSWDEIVEVKRLGLNDERLNLTHVLKYKKILELNETCKSNPEIIMELLDLRNYNISIFLTSNGKKLLLYCNNTYTVRKSLPVKRLVVINQDGEFREGVLLLEVSSLK